ncbi:uncharacterized protein EV420DRAFT_1648417 [Desarmillaria tabescens]|uniref:Uncharacterized protein n=1 Tax=Armillaria tabescens TaxID=1929756 RepID=A0AA39MTB5_ARMTA|nr:uncharacterized protein EV420DRAFT_1648417 [Desarmillaria tabescens]KAK0445279.1 hypothetical protein EV420DRAFT_1648417 [Desarmillaria tabescens]
MLWEELNDYDIPHHTYIWKCVIETWEKYIATLKGEIESSLGQISITMDLSTDLNLINFMAVTAHWMEAIGINADGLTIICLHSDLIGFQRMMQLWEDLKIKFPETAPAIQDSLKKLKTYQDHTEVVPAYTLATILNPNTKLCWFN